MGKKAKYNTLCVDCGYETQPREAKDNYEQCILGDEVWLAAGMSLAKRIPVQPKAGKKDFLNEPAELVGGGGCLCVGCIEKRLGRPLNFWDFASSTTDLMFIRRDHGWYSPRLCAALFRFEGRPRPVPRPLINALRHGELSEVVGGEIDGDDVYLMVSDAKEKGGLSAWHFIAGKEFKEAVALYETDYKEFRRWVKMGTLSAELLAPPANALLNPDAKEDVPWLEEFLAKP